MPLVAGAAAGHFMLGAPTDLLHFVFYRAWVKQPRPTDYQFTPARAPRWPERGDGPEPDPVPKTKPITKTGEKPAEPKKDSEAGKPEAGKR